MVIKFVKVFEKGRETSKVKDFDKNKFYGIRLVDSTDACVCDIICVRLRNLCIICINFINRITSISDLCI